MLFLFKCLKVLSWLLLSSMWLACQEPQFDRQAAATAVDKSASMPQRGDAVAPDLVCMVNDVYMGKKQLAVPFEGKTYYGCCAMCQERIPQDKSVRYAIDPYSMKPVDKADAYIVLIGHGGEVAYFENEGHYRDFLKTNKPST